tara:strand:+ start:56 stop:394 length:339 start_codon:yes stop_codon:yes gene_type:complete
MRLNDVSPKQWDKMLKDKLKADRQDAYQKNPTGFSEDYSIAEDSVNSPKHYNTGGIECIESIEASMSKLEFAGYLKGNLSKYIWRYNYKGKPKEDLLKAKWYLERLLQTTGD